MATGWQKSIASFEREASEICAIVDLREAIWKRKIDQMSTGDIAATFRLGPRKTLRLLKEIASGQSIDKRFVYNEERQGVAILDGSIFTYSEVSIDGKSTGGKQPKHYIWFCS